MTAADPTPLGELVASIAAMLDDGFSAAEILALAEAKQDEK